MEWMSVVAGLAAGVLIGMTGVGGGSLMTPLLTLLLGAPPLVAVGTDLAFSAITKSAGAAAHASQKTVDWKAACWLWAGALPAAALAAFGLWLGGGVSASGEWVKWVIAAAAGMTVLSLVFKNALNRWLDRAPGRRLSGAALAGATAGAGAVIGALVALSSIGAGAIGASVLALLYPRLKPAQIAGTDIAFALPLTALAALAHWWMGSVDWALLGALLAGSVPGILLGAKVARGVPERASRGVLIVALSAVTIAMLASV